ncbi:hypothetical protein [Thiohalocapsa sp. ML1]|uniref:hypothetical protein n=1 Tax=Thiohalocapsa sp. ML1 TaxID=1431688 RepID=UPI00156DFF81|nr:hypothetical protein [Thiohalocapsa sp. ML1]
MNRQRSHPSARPPVPAPQTLPDRPPIGTRVLGWFLMSMTLGLVSCQSLYVL